MKDQKVLVLIIFFSLFLFFNQAFPQNNEAIKNYEYSNFYFKGVKGEKNIYQFNYPITTSSSEVGERFDLYYPSLENNNRVSFKFYQSFDYYIYYMKDDLILVGKSDPDSIFIISENEEKSIEKIGDMNFYRRTHYLTQGDFFYFSTVINNISYLTRIDVSGENPQMEVLPVKGMNPILLKNWLYYIIPYDAPGHGISSQGSIYRVKIGEWYHPELVVDKVEFGGAVIDTHLISFGVHDRKEWRKVTYNISDSTYIEQQISSLIKYKGKRYQRTLCKNSKTNKTQLCFKDIPELPEEFPHKLKRDIEPNHNYFHLPHTQKPFAGTFITDSLMFFAGEEELNTLSKAQLRKLRNAFYAHEGYDFSSQDLKNFFSQFEWHTQTLERRKDFELTNDDIFMPPANKERIKLIQSVEQSK